MGIQRAAYEYGGAYGEVVTMTRRRRWLLALSICVFFIPFTVSATETGSVTEDFGTTFRREERNTYAVWSTQNRTVTLPLREGTQEFVPSAAVEFKKMVDAGSGKFFKYATLSVMRERPNGTAFSFMLSADGGLHWEEVAEDIRHEFKYTGSDLRFRAVLSTDVPSATPKLIKVRLDFVKELVETPSVIRNRDNKRIADLKNLASKLEKFKKERLSYPITDDQKAEVRWNMLGQLLMEGKFVTVLPVDPLHDQDAERRYDYVSNKSGTGYVLRARLDDPEHKDLKKDLDGEPIEPSVYEYTCNDPWYCEGKGVMTLSASVVIPPVVGTAELLQDAQGRIYRIATIGGGADAAEKRRLYLPSPALLQKLRTFYGRIRKVGEEVVADIPRARLIKTEDKNDIYYITQTNLKRRLPSWEIFKSYGNNRREVVIVKSEEVEAYPDSRLIRLVGDKRVWFLEGGSRRLVLSPEIMKQHGLNFKHVAPVNFAEYNSYPEGSPLE